MPKAILYLTARKNKSGEWGIYGGTNKAKVLKGETSHLGKAENKAHAIRAVKKMKENNEAKGRTVKVIAS